MLAHMILCTTRANSSLKRFNSHAGTPSTPVAFLGFMCLSVHFTCPVADKGGGTSFKRCEAIWRSGTSVGQMFCQGLINAFCNCSARYSVTSAGGIQFRELLIVASPYTGCIKKLNKFEIALNVAKRLKV